MIPELDKMNLKIDNFTIEIPEYVLKDDVQREKLTDEYIEKNWKELVGIALSSYDEDYYKSEQYKLDRGKYLMEKYK